MAGNRKFDEELRMKKGREAYRLDKIKGGRAGSSAGQPRPYAKQTIQIARLHSPQLIGHSLLVTPKHQYRTLRVGQVYEWQVYDEGLGEIEGYDVDARELREHFVIKVKGKK